MQKILLILATFLNLFAIYAQDGVGINSNNTAPFDGAVLDVSSTTKGLLIPRLNTVAINNLGLIPAPAGLLVYNTDQHAFNYYDGTQWLAFPQVPLKEISSASGATKVQVDKPGDGSENKIHFRVSNSDVAEITSLGINLLSQNDSIDYMIGGKHAFSAPPTKSTFAGEYAGDKHIIEQNETFIGASAGAFATGATISNNTVFGANSANTSGLGQNNVIVGAQSGNKLNQTAHDNTTAGYNLLTNGISSSNNTLIGTSSLLACTSGNENTVIGSNTANSITTGSKNVFVGTNMTYASPTLSDNVDIAGLISANAATGEVTFNKMYSFPPLDGNASSIMVLKSNKFIWAEKIPKSVVSAAAELQPYDRGVASANSAVGSANTVYYMEAFSFTTADMNSFITNIYSNASATPVTIKMAIYQDEDKNGTYDLAVYGQSLIPALSTGSATVKFGYSSDFTTDPNGIRTLLTDAGLPASALEYKIKAGGQYYIALSASSTALTFKSLTKINSVYSQAHASAGLPTVMSTTTPSNIQYWIRGFWED